MDGVTAYISSQTRHGASSVSRLLSERHSACSVIETCRGAFSTSPGSFPARRRLCERLAT